MNSLWMTLFYGPLYNILVFFTTISPWHNLGIAVILLTVFVKLITFPLTQKSLKSQIQMKEIEPELEQVKKEFPNKEDQAKKTFELYKKYGINPFSGCVVLLIQLPVLLALYRVFMNGVLYDPSLLYSFVHIPETLNTQFLGIDIAGKTILLALLAGIAQFIQVKLATPIVTKKASENDSFKDQIMSNMNSQMKFMMPLLIAFVAYSISGAVALYLLVNSLVSIVQEMLIRNKLKKEAIL